HTLLMGLDGPCRRSIDHTCFLPNSIGALSLLALIQCRNDLRGIAVLQKPVFRAPGSFPAALHRSCHDYQVGQKGWSPAYFLHNQPNLHWLPFGWAPDSTES